MTISIRAAAPTDASTIAHFNNRLAEETESRTLLPKLIGSGVAALLADPSKGRYWVAEFDGEVIGQIGVTYEWSDWRNGMMWWIQSVYVNENHRRKGVYSSLYRQVESLARSDPDVIGLRLYVEKENERAQATYSKMGMKATNYQIMQVFFESENRQGEREC